MLPDLPLAPGTIPDCEMYRNYRRRADDTSMNSTVSGDANICRWTASYYDITIDQLVTWNPSLTVDGCRLSFGYRYCVLRHLDDTENLSED
jgi:hypothetical protein